MKSKKPLGGPNNWKRAVMHNANKQGTQQINILHCTGVHIATHEMASESTMGTMADGALSPQYRRSLRDYQNHDEIYVR